MDDFPEAVGKQFMQDHLLELSKREMSRTVAINRLQNDMFSGRPIPLARAAAAEVLQSGGTLKEAEESFVKAAGGMQAVIDSAVGTRFGGYSDKYPAIARKFEPVKDLMEGAGKEVAGKRVGVMSKKTLGGILDSLRQAIKVTS